MFVGTPPRDLPGDPIPNSLLTQGEEHRQALASARRVHEAALDQAKKQVTALRQQLVACASGNAALANAGHGILTPKTVPWEDLEAMVQDAPEVGRGGFGPVYKCGWNGDTVAVKKLAVNSSQGVEQFHKVRVPCGGGGVGVRGTGQAGEVPCGGVGGVWG